MDYLCELPNDASRRGALATLPPNLEETYEWILDRLNKKNVHSRSLVKRVLMWLVCSKTPLTLEALAEAIAINEGDERLNRARLSSSKRILRLCSSFVRSVDNPPRIELAHFSAREFLLAIADCESS